MLVIIAADSHIWSTIRYGDVTHRIPKALGEDVSDFDLTINLLSIPYDCYRLGAELASNCNVLIDIETCHIVWMAIHNVLLICLWVQDDTEAASVINYFAFGIKFEVVSAVKWSIAVDIVDWEILGRRQGARFALLDSSI